MKINGNTSGKPQGYNRTYVELKSRKPACPAMAAQL